MNNYTLQLDKGLYHDVQPYDQGMLDVGDGHFVYWETCGNPKGKPVLQFTAGQAPGQLPIGGNFLF